MSLLTIAILLFIFGLVIFVIDLMIPSGGILIGVTACFAFAAIIVAFRHSSLAGLCMLFATACAIPMGMWMFIEIWPRTPLGKRLISQPAPAGEYNWSDVSKTTNVHSLIASEGIALVDMIPSGLVQIGTKSYEAFSESGPIDQGQPVRVIRIDVGRLVVIKSVPKQSNVPMSDGTGLDRPISDLNLESLDS